VFHRPTPSTPPTPRLALAALLLAALPWPVPAAAGPYRIGPVETAEGGAAFTWPEEAFAIRTMIAPEEPTPPAPQLDARARFGLDGSHLVVEVSVRNRVAREHPLDRSLRDRDALILELGGPAGEIELTVAPGDDPRHPEPRMHLEDRRPWSGEAAPAPLEPRLTRQRLEAGYRLTLAVDLAPLGAGPGAGPFTLRLTVHDTERDGSAPHRVRWPATGPPASFEAGEAPSAPLAWAATVAAPSMRHLEARVQAIPEYAGREVHLERDGERIASAPLRETGGRSLATFRLPLPGPAGEAPPLTVHVEEAGSRPVGVPDLGALRARRLALEPVGLDAYVFSGPTLPDPAAPRPLTLAALAGDARLSVRWFNEHGELVTRADRPGRYGAVVRIERPDAPELERLLTAYRTATPVDWARFDGRAIMDLPDGVGIDRNVLHEQDQAIGAYLQQQFVESLTADPESAVLFAALYESATLEPPYPPVAELERAWWAGTRRARYALENRWPGPIGPPASLAPDTAPTLRSGLPDEAGFTAAQVNPIETFAREWAEAEGGFALAIARHGILVVNQAYGQAGGRRVTRSRRGPIGTLGELPVAILAAIASAQDLLDPGAPAGRLLPPLEAGFPDLALEHLLTHTAGFEPLAPARGIDLAERAGGLAGHITPGARHRPSGVHYRLLSLALENATGQSIHALVRKHVLEPIGASATDFRGPGAGRATADNLARIGQLLLAEGRWGEKRLFSEAASDRLRPHRLTELLGPKTPHVAGWALFPLDHPALGEGAFGHTAPSGTTLIVAPAHDLVITLMRYEPGPGYASRRAKLIELIAGGQ